MSTIVVEPPAPPLHPRPSDRLGRWLRLPNSDPSGPWLVHDGLGRQGRLHLLKGPPTEAHAALALVTHPAVPLTLGLEAAPAPHWVTAVPPGEPVAQRIQRGRLPRERALRVLAMVAGALAACHRRGVSHGALGPSTVFVDGARVSLVGFAFRGSPSDDVRDLARLARVLLADQVPDRLANLVDAARAAEASLRPRAIQFAQALRGVAPTAPGDRPGPAAFRARTHAMHIDHPAVHDPVRRWVGVGGALAVVGPSGSGRTRAIDVACQVAFAGGWPFVVLHPSALPWGSVAAALADEGLPGLPEPLPDAADTRSRAERAAEILLARADGRLRVLVDDWTELDQGTEALVEAVHRRGAAVLVAGGRAPSWVHQVVHLAAWSVEDAEQLVGRAVSPTDASAVVQLVNRQGPLVPGRLLDTVCQGSRWDIRDLDADARELGGLLALAGPMPRNRVLRMLAPPESARAAVQRLLLQGWLRGTTTLRCSGPAARDALVDALTQPRDTWAAVARGLGEVPSMQLGVALAGARDVAGIRALGAACVRASVSMEPGFAADLGRKLHAIAPGAALVEATVRAADAADRVDEARRFGAEWVAAPAGGPDDLGVLVALAELEQRTGAGSDDVFAWIQRARGLLGGTPAPPSLVMAEARAWLAAGDPETADEVLGPIVLVPPDVDAPSPWLLARSLQASVTEAIRGPDAALDVVEAVPEALGGGSVARAELDAVRAELLQTVGRPAEAASQWLEVAECAGLPTFRRRAMRVLAGRAWVAAGQPRLAVEAWAPVVAEGRSEPSLQIELARALTFLGRFEEAELHTRAALIHAEAPASALLARIAQGRGALARAVRLCELSDGRATRVGREDVLVDMACIRAEIGVQRREADALSLVVHAHNAALRVEAAGSVAVCDALRAVLAARAGHRRSVEQFAGQANRIAARTADPDVIGRVWLWLAEARLAMGQREDALRLARQVRADAERGGLVPLVQWARQVCTRSGSPARHDPRALERITDCTLRLVRHLDVGDLLSELATAAVDLCDARAAIVLRQDDAGVRAVASSGDAVNPPIDVAERALHLQRTLAESQPDGRLALVAPLVVDAKPWGAVLVAGAGGKTSESEGPPTPELVARLQALSAHAAVALARAEEQLRRDEQAARMREIAHDVRSPLSGIGMLARGAVLDGEGLSVEDAAMIADAADHAMAVVSAWSAKERQVLQWSSAVQGWVRALGPEASHAEVGLVMDGSAGGEVSGCRTDLRRVVTNLVGNAIKHSPAGTTVRVTTLHEDAWVGVHIDDDGSGLGGIPPEYLFEAGVQGPHAAAGQGLGLSIVRRICVEHGGTVVAQDRERGSRFTVRLPRVSAETG